MFLIPAVIIVTMLMGVAGLFQGEQISVEGAAKLKTKWHED